MLTAYLRGLLKPDYKRGIRSILRENAILDALDREQLAAIGMQQLALEQSFVGAYNMEGVRKLLKNFMSKWPTYSSWAMQRPAHLKQSSIPTAEAKAMQSLYEALEKSGLFEQIAAQPD